MSAGERPTDMEERPQIRLRLEQITDWEARAVEAKYSPRTVASECGFSMRHVQRFMGKRFKVGLREFVAGVRMAKARNLLRSGFTIKETSVGLGFKQVSHFCRCFKQHFRVSPSVALRSLAVEGKEGASDDSQLELDFVRAKARPLKKATGTPQKVARKGRPGRGGTKKN